MRHGTCLGMVLALPRDTSTASRVVRRSAQRGRCRRRHTPRSLTSLGMTITAAIFFVVCSVGYFFAAPRLLKNSRRSFPVPRFVRGFPQASTGKSYRPQFLHKGEMFFGCGSQDCD